MSHPAPPRHTAVIIGAGPAGLTAAYELVTRTAITPRVVELTDQLGGISRTVNHRGNRMDIGGHRFFSKSDRVMNWWMDMMPIQEGAQEGLNLTYQGATTPLRTPHQHLLRPQVL